MKDSARYLTASEAAEALGVSRPTLYAYVSRGLVRSESASSKRRERRYRREDVERLLTRRLQRRNPDRAAEQALSWGMPVLESSLCLIADGRLYYRGQDALALAQESTFEQVMELLWLGDMPARPAALAQAIEMGRASLQSIRQTPGARLDWLPAAAPVEIFQAILPLAAMRDAAAYNLRPAAVALTGARILGLLAAAATIPAQPDSGRMAERIWNGWGRKGAGSRQEQSTRLIEAALILSADHELNTSAFTARCVASVRATPYQVVMAGLAAVQGARHGGYMERVEALLDEAGSAARAGSAVGAWLKRGGALPGFGHPLYPDGDPRARVLMDLAGRAAPRSRQVALGRAIVKEALATQGEHPTIDFGLVVAARALGLPRGAPLALFALGRTAGWIAHAIEQYETALMIRPRARYVGQLPDSR